MPALRIRERAPLRLNVSVATPDGDLARWGTDDPDPRKAPQSLTFSTVAPGGFENFSCVLEERFQDDGGGGVDRDSDLELASVTVRGPGGSIAWQGRIEQLPDVAGLQAQVTPTGVGWQSHLDDDSSAAMIYIDRTLGAWGAPSLTRQINLINDYGYGLNTFASQVAADPTTNNPSLYFSAGGGWTGLQVAEAWYDAAGAGGVGYIQCTNCGTVGIDWYDPNAICVVDACTDAVATAYIGSNLDFTFGEPGRLGPCGSAYPFALIQAGYATGGGDPGTTYGYAFANLAVIGNHGLSIQTGPSGLSPGTDDGLLSSDIEAHALATWCPALSFTTGASGSIQPSAFVIPQLAFATPTTASAIIKAATQYELRDWMVWDGPGGVPTYYSNARGARGRQWRARVGPAQLQDTGPNISRIFNGVVVTWTDVTGVTMSVGPPGSGADFASSSLLDLDPENPANALSYGGHTLRRWALVTMGTSTLAGATQVGAVFLQYQREVDTSGQATLTGHVEDSYGVLWPAWQVRGGDTIVFTDGHDTSPRRIVHTSYDDTTKANSIQLDQPPASLTALLERLSVVLSAVGLS